MPQEFSDRHRVHLAGVLIFVVFTAGQLVWIHLDRWPIASDPVVNYHQIISPTLGLPWSAQWFFTPPGASYVFTTTWIFTDVNTFDVWAQVDSNGDITESFEDNNTKKVNVGALTAHSFRHDTHEDFLINMASTLDNSRLRADSVISASDGVLQLGRFSEPPLYKRPFTNDNCEITTDIAISDF